MEDRIVWRTSPGGEDCPLRVTVACAVWLWLYCADLRLIWDQPLHLLIAPVVLGMTLDRARFPTRNMLVLWGLLLSALVYQSVVDKQLMSRELLELAMLGYVFSLSPLRTDNGVARIGNAMAAFYVVSMTLFLLTVFVPGASEIRAALYMTSVKRMAAVDDEVLETAAQALEQGGLSFFLHNFGYQLASAAAYFVALASAGKGTGTVRWTAAVVLSAVSILLAGQRSAVVGAVCALLLVMTIVRRARALVVLAVVAIVAWTTSELGGFNDVRSYNTLGRLETYSDTESRLTLQAWALTAALEYPLGIVGAGVNYAEIAPVHDMRGPVAPHNGYVTRLLWFGWPIALFVGAIFRALWLMARRTITAGASRASSVWEVASLAALASVMINALFHNASFVTFHSDTLTMMFLYAGAWSASRASLAAATPPSPLREGGVR
jgi:hypothetical protein